MSDSRPDYREGETARATSLWMPHRILAAVCMLVVAVYGYIARVGESWSPNPPDAFYNLLVQGFRAGQLSLKKEVPPGLTHLADPYDPTANGPYRGGPDHVHDLSYYHGRLYLYYGITPALILFWPFAALSGHYLSQRQAAAIFSGLGFLVGTGLARALWRRYFPKVNVWVVATCTVALGLATAVPVMLPRSSYNEAAIGCGYMLTMLALAAIWCAMHESQNRSRWLAAAGLAYGLAVGARASLLFGAVILLVPVVQAWRERQRAWVPLIAAIGPIALIGLGLMLYNALRFGSPFEFGQHYQLAGVRSTARQYFRWGYLWFNFRMYFLQPARWTAHFPFIHEIVPPSLPPGFERIEAPFGILVNIPVVWLALAAPLAWRNRSEQQGSILRWFAAVLSLLFAICALTLGLFASAIIRYEVDFLPTLLLLAIIGLLGLEHVLASPPGSGRIRGRLVRSGWAVLLGFSVAINLLASVQVYANERCDYGILLVQAGPPSEAIQVLEEVLRLKPDYAEAHVALGLALEKLGKIEEAIGHYEQALRIKPDYPAAHNHLGTALMKQGKHEEAMKHYEAALRIQPGNAAAHCNLGLTLERLGRTQEAIQHYEQALRIKPDFVEAQSALARARAAQ